MASSNTASEQRKQQELEFQRSLVIAVAEKRFAEHGYRATTMEEIAKESGFAVGSLYKLFKNKQDLYAAMLREKVDAIEPRVTFAIKSADSPVAKLEAYFRQRIQMFWDHPRFFKMYYRDLATPFGDRNQGLTPEISARYEEHLSIVESIFSDGIGQDIFKRMSPRILTLLSEGVIRSYTASLGLQDEPERDPEEEDQILELFLDGILNRSKEAESDEDI